MIGNEVSIAGMNETYDISAFFDQAPSLVGSGQIGTEVNVAVSFVAGVQPGTVTYQWYAADAPLPGETEASLMVTAEMDTIPLKCAVTAGVAGSFQMVETPPVIPLYEAPRGLAELYDEILDINSGPQNIDISSAFIGSDLSYSVSGATGVTIDPVEGVLTIETGRPAGALDLNVSARNSGGVWQARLSVTLEDQPQANQVLDLTATNTGLWTDSHDFPTGDIDGTGIWISGFVFYTGSGWGNPRLAGLANSSEGDEYININVGSIALRNGGPTQQLDAFEALTSPGWYLATARIWRDGAGAVRFSLLRNGLTSSAASYGGTFDITSFNRLGWGILPDSTPQYGASRTAGLAWGRGDPTAYHAAVHNGGAFADPASYDFDADPAATLLGYEAGARMRDDDNVLDVADLSEPWEIEGSPAWFDLPPPYAGGAFGSLKALSAAPTPAGNTIEIVTDLLSEDWDNPTVDLSKVTFWAERGYGSLSAVDASVTTEGSLATVTFTVSRTVFAGEDVRMMLASAWISDASGNRGSGATAMPVENLSDFAVPARVSGLSHGQVAFDFARAYEAGITPDGVMWVRDEGDGVDIAHKTPAQSTAMQGVVERVIHGTMKNPQRREDNFQGYTSVGSEADVRFDPDLAIGFPVTLQTGDSLIGAVGNPAPYAQNGGREGHPVNISQYQGLIVTDFVPGEDDVPPPLVGYDAATRPAWIKVDVPAIVSALPAGYDTTGFDRPDEDIVIARIERFHPALMQFGQVEMKREMTPSGFTDADGYGVNFIGTISAALLLLVDRSTSSPQRERIVRWIVHHYRQWYGLGKLSPNGGHNQGSLGFLVLGDYWANGGAGIPTMLDDMGGNESTAFRIADRSALDQITLPHDNTPGWPRFSRRSMVSSVSGNRITIDRIDRLKGSTLRDASRELQNLLMVRETDGAQVEVTGYNDNTGVLTLSANTHGFSVGDPIYFKAPWTQSVGDYEWIIRIVDGMEEYTPSNNAVYRNLNYWSAEVLVMRALGLIHPSLDAVQGYVEMANRGNQPTSGNDFPAHHVTFVYGSSEPASGTSRWAKSFWGAHWDTIKAVPQLY
jgi:hypothetical protein